MYLRYETLLLCGNRADRPLPYEAKLRWISRFFSGAGYKSLRKTHAGSAQGAQHAELNGVNEAQNRRVSRSGIGKYAITCNYILSVSTRKYFSTF